MVYYERSQPELYQGRNLDAEYHRFAHRNRIELVHAYSVEAVNAAAGRFGGADFPPQKGYEGPGEGVGNRIVPATFYGPGKEFDDRAGAWRKADEWMTFLKERLPRAITLSLPAGRTLATAVRLHSPTCRQRSQQPRPRTRAAHDGHARLRRGAGRRD